MAIWAAEGQDVALVEARPPSGPSSMLGSSTRCTWRWRPFCWAMVSGSSSNDESTSMATRAPNCTCSAGIAHAQVESGLAGIERVTGHQGGDIQAAGHRRTPRTQGRLTPIVRGTSALGLCAPKQGRGVRGWGWPGRGCSSSAWRCSLLRVARTRWAVPRRRPSPSTTASTSRPPTRWWRPSRSRPASRSRSATTTRTCSPTRSSRRARTRRPTSFYTENSPAARVLCRRRDLLAPIDASTLAAVPAEVQLAAGRLGRRVGPGRA